MKISFWTLLLFLLVSGCFMEETQAPKSKEGPIQNENSEKQPAQGDQPAKLVKSVSFQNPSVSVQGAGKEIRLIVVIVFEDGTVDMGDPQQVPLEWSSNNPGVATVDAKGVVKTVSAGEASVTVKVGSRSAAVKIIVESIPSRDPAVNKNENPSSPVSKPPDPSSPAPPAPPSPPPPPPPSSPPAKETIPCKKADSYIGNVVSFKKGENGGFNEDKLPAVVLGPPKGAGEMMGSLDVLSLGKGGEIVLEFNHCMIVDGEGPDFTVFENPFLFFPEPGFVGISQDGVSFVEFPCNLSEESYPACAGVHPVFANPDWNTLDPTDPKVSGGDPFDLAALGLKNARFVRIRDSGLGLGPIGCPFKPDQCTWGFDLDAIVIINGLVP